MNVNLLLIFILIGAIYFLFHNDSNSSKNIKDNNDIKTNKINTPTNLKQVLTTENKKSFNVFPIGQSSFNQPPLNKEQEFVFSQIESSHNHCFVTGQAGTGKSHLLRFLKKHGSVKSIVLAPTGKAAVNIGGQTIHSFFKFPPSLLQPSKIRANSRVVEIVNHLDRLIIDEISMVRADLLDAIDIALRKSRNSHQPFGGVQLIMFGDLYQLPPVVASSEEKRYFQDNYNSYYFFHAHVWDKVDFKIFNLQRVVRQKDPKFIQILNAIRNGDVGNNILNTLNQRLIYKLNVDERNAGHENNIMLTTTNKKVDQINQIGLSKLNTPKHTYTAIINGKFDQKSFPADLYLNLKVGARIMMIKNDVNQRWFNGSMGTVSALNDDLITVEINNQEHLVARESWDKIEYKYNHRENKMEEEIIGTFTQFPLRLAWAVTIHKSQGQTYDDVLIDLEKGAFSHGQTYVALSRCRTLRGIKLVKPVLKEDIIVDPVIKDFMKRENQNNVRLEYNQLSLER